MTGRETAGETVTIPVTVIGGYLGAGKTTLVNHLLRNAEGLRIAVLVNDFGSLAIDADLIEAQQDDLISIAGGCVCCSFGSDLMAALMRLAERDPLPQHVLIETSGVALPGLVARSAALLARFEINAVAVLADAETIIVRAADRFMGDTISRQLNEADLVLLNKTDLVDLGGLEVLRSWMRVAAPHAGLLEMVHGRIPLELLFGGAIVSASRTSVNPLKTGPIRPIEDAWDRYESLSFTPGALDTAALAAALSQPALGLLRAKGLLRDHDGSFKILQVVGKRHAVAPHSARPDIRPGLVCIGQSGRIDHAGVATALARAMRLTSGDANPNRLE